jgi:methanogenic corrinoid protein MtbC1
VSQAVNEILTSSSGVLARWTVERQVEMNGRKQSVMSCVADGDPGGEGSWFDDWAQDTRGRIEALSVAVEFASPGLFLSEIEWARSAFSARGVPIAGLVQNLSALREVLATRLPPQGRDETIRIVDRGLSMLSREVDPSTCLPPVEQRLGPSDHSLLLKQYLVAMLESRRDDAYQAVLGAVRSGVSISDVYRWVIDPAMVEIGHMWMNGEIGVGEEHFATSGTQHVMARLHDHFKAAPRRDKSVMCATVSGDLHEVGLRMVSDLFELSGWTSMYLGASMPAFALIESARRARPTLIALSAKLVHHVREAANTVRAIRDVPELDDIPIMVGGRPFVTDLDLYLKVGADACAASAWEAVEIGERLTSGARSA